MLGQEVQKEADQEQIVTPVTERESTEQILTKLLEKTTKQLFYTRCRGNCYVDCRTLVKMMLRRRDV